MSKRDIPYTSNDLRDIANRIDEIVGALGGGDIDDGSWIWGLSVDVTDDDGYSVGLVRPHGDGWLGFYPNAVDG